MTVSVLNAFDVPIKIAKIKTAVNPPAAVFKTHWEGNKTIPAGGQHAFVFNTDVGCKNIAGADRYWKLRFVRDNGKVHKDCGNYNKVAGVTLKKSDRCSKRW